jgi:DNA (cytosine-5)-methyltransferase 1
MRMDNQEALGGQLLPAAFDVRNGIETGDVTHTLQAKQGVSLNQAPVISVALRGREDGAALEASDDDAAFALRAGQGSDKALTPACTRVHVAFDCQIKGTERTRCVRTGDYAQCQAGRPDAITVPNGGAVAGTLAASGAGTARTAGRQENETDFLVEHELGVRRLTPVECERLQGFPDGWTSVIWERAQRVDAETLAYLRAHYEHAYGVRLDDDQVRRLMSDAARYRMLGNAVTVPVAAWIGRRIMQVEECAA